MANVETRMASIVIPNMNEDGDIFVPIQQEAVEIFIDDFGGATAYECNGFWDKSQRVISCLKIDVAVDMLPLTVAKFMATAELLAYKLNVHSVMVTKPDGTVVFVKGGLYDGTTQTNS